jgi:hypothetical protein
MTAVGWGGSFQFSVAEGEGLPRRGEEREGENARVEGGEHRAAGRGFKFSIPSALHSPLSAFRFPPSAFRFLERSSPAPPPDPTFRPGGNDLE